MRSQASLCAGIELIDMVLHGVHLRLHLTHAHLPSEPRDADYVVDRTILAKQWIGAPQSCVNIRLLISKTKGWPENTNDRVVDAVQSDGLAERRRAARKTVLPQTIADNDRRHAARPI